jgi:hypothetical protein
MMIDGYVLDTNSNQILDFDQRRFAETFFFFVFSECFGVTLG